MKRIIFKIFIIVIFIAIIWSAIWAFAAFKIKAEMANLANPINSEQAIISCDNFSVKGFPFKLDMNCKNGIYINGDDRVTLANINTSIFLPLPIKVKIIATSPLNYSNAFFASEQELSWSEFVANISIKFFRFEKFQLNMKNIKYIDLLIGENLIARANNLTIDLSDNQDKYDKASSTASVDLNVNSENLDISVANINEAKLQLFAEISSLPDDIRQFTNPDFLYAWQQANGQINLLSFDASDKSSEIKISGNIRLENNGYLNGKFAINSNGVIEQISHIVPQGMVPIIFGSPKENGSYQQNIRIREGVVYSGIVPITKLVPLF